MVVVVGGRQREARVMRSVRRGDELLPRAAVRCCRAAAACSRANESQHCRSAAHMPPCLLAREQRCGCRRANENKRQKLVMSAP